MLIDVGSATASAPAKHVLAGLLGRDIPAFTLLRLPRPKPTPKAWPWTTSCSDFAALNLGGRPISSSSWGTSRGGFSRGSM